jgi:hypothetical protein
LMSPNRTKRVFQSHFATMNSRKRASLRFNEIIDRYLEEENARHAEVVATICGFDVDTTVNDRGTKFLVRCLFDPEATQILNQGRAGILKALAPNERILLRHTLNHPAHMSVAAAYCEDTAYECASLLESTDLNGTVVLFGEATSYTF